MVEQIDFLSKQEIRDNAMRRRTAPADPKAEKAEADGGQPRKSPPTKSSAARLEQHRKRHRAPDRRSVD